jgi:prolyl oligopeptidase
VEVVDPWRWLEDGRSPEVDAWTRAQDQRTRRFLAALPERAAIAERVRALLTAQDSVRWREPEWRGGRLFALRRLPRQQQFALVVLPGPDAAAAARPVVDPNAMDASGTTAIDWYVPSPDGRLVAVSLSKGGTESGDLHFFDVESGARADVIVPRVQGGTAGGDAAWTADGKGIFYTRYPKPGERPDADLDFHQQVWFHRLGTPVTQDRYEAGKDFPRTAEVTLETQERTGRVLATVQLGDSGRFRHYLREPKGGWRRLTDWGDDVSGAAFGPRDELFVVSRKGAPRGRLLRLALPAASLARAAVVVEQSAEVLDWSFYSPSSLAVTPGRIYLTYQLGGPTAVRAFTHRGAPVPGPRTPEASANVQPVRLAGDAILFASTSYTSPPAWYRYDPAGDRTEKTSLATTSPADLSDAEVRREWATSKDGTRVPYTVVMRRGTPLDGSAPLVATGYGGYGNSLEPGFDPTLRIWLDRGGVYVVANVRGGGELGREWHEQGRLARKQNVFDDFEAVLRQLVARGYTRPERLAIEGGSNGGILMGAILTQHPDLVRAVVSHVGVYDMIRSELSPNGEFNVPEFGTVKDPGQFRAMYAYSPYHRVRPGTRYPALFLLTGANDPRVDPMHSRKLLAAVQAATASDRPVLLRASFDTGHGVDTRLDERIEREADVYAFLLWELGVTRPPGGRT